MSGPYWNADTGRYETGEEREARWESCSNRDKEVRRETKREYFDKLKTMEFWTAVVNDDDPEGKAYALHVLDCIQSALRRKT